MVASEDVADLASEETTVAPEMELQRCSDCTEKKDAAADEFLGSEFWAWGVRGSREKTCDRKDAAHKGSHAHKGTIRVHPPPISVPGTKAFRISR